MRDLNEYLNQEVPRLVIERVDANKMKTMAAILRDPYPVHWDRESNAILNLKGRVINQGPLNLSYIANMLIAWQGPSCIKRLQARFLKPVLDEETVVATGKVVEIIKPEVGRVRVQVWLSREDEVVLEGEAEIEISD
jgi:acyl dehydratase